MKLQVIVGSTRPGRVTEKVAKWVAAEAAQLPETEVELVDLSDYPMPFLDEPRSPRFNPDRHPNAQAQKWMDKIAEGDAYVFVTPEYNHSISSVLKNAIDYLTFEMVRKPATVVAHGTVGGARATMHLKDILSESRAAVTPVQVALVPPALQHIDEDGEADEEITKAEHGAQAALRHALTELEWYSDALAAARAQNT
jgi:NAD(P)H-dependent FMN reductase